MSNISQEADQLSGFDVQTCLPNFAEGDIPIFKEIEITKNDPWTHLSDATYIFPSPKDVKTGPEQGDMKQHRWKAIQRVTQGNTGVDSVAVAPIIIDEHGNLWTIVTAQIRIPPSTTGIVPQITSVVDFPAGLLDKNETPEEAAIRELREETGLTGKIDWKSPILATDAGMTGATAQLVTAICESSVSGTTHFDDDEKLISGKIPLCKLPESVEKYRSRGPDDSEIRTLMGPSLASFAMAIRLLSNNPVLLSSVLIGSNKNKE
ncbi:uncharacterized protein L201_003027 [Kwoniella dendrophila CBS 6074]|uniref:Nudix hydrolase domain-containing protein n=1 Tax=Kwoniella dendrophila CBS 6074 TaxID=1295534 RepID=A0AAX4JUE8_9TREE